MFDADRYYKNFSCLISIETDPTLRMTPKISLVYCYVLNVKIFCVIN